MLGKERISFLTQLVSCNDDLRNEPERVLRWAEGEVGKDEKDDHASSKVVEVASRKVVQS